MSTKEKILKLIGDKEKVEAKIKDFGFHLEANNVGMHEPLVDPQGFPRTDIDVHQVRAARHQIICLQNDHKGLMKAIEELLHELHATNNVTNNVTHNGEEIANRTREIALTEEIEIRVAPMNAPPRPIAKIDMVVANSPAEKAVSSHLSYAQQRAGCKSGDLVIEFGTINIINFRNLGQLGEIVQHMENLKIPLKIQRDQNLLELILIPKVWNGRGLLGCNIVLFS